MNMKFNFNNPTNLIFGSGSLNQMGRRLPKGKPMVLLGERPFCCPPTESPQR